MSWSIYRIYSDKGDLQYYGSTIMDIKKRLKSHINSFKYPSSNQRACASKILFKTYGVEHCYIEVIEEGTDDTRYDRESYYISNNVCINIRNPKALNPAEWYQANKQRIKEKYQEDKKIRESFRK